MIRLQAVRLACAIGWAGSVLIGGCGSAHSDGTQHAAGGASGSAGSAEGGRKTSESAGAGAGGALAKAGAGGTAGDASAQAGSGGGLLPTTGGAGGDLPVDTRPERPIWDPPFPVGAPGWRQSSALLCEKHVGDQEAFDVWADSRGVFGLFATTCNVLGGTSCGKQGVSLQVNDGSGWRPIYALPPGPGMGSNGALFLSGFESGPLLLSGYLRDRAGVWRVTADGAVTLDAPFEVGRPFTVNGRSAYAIDAEKLYRFADEAWSEDQPLPAPSQDLWADENRTVLVGADQAVFQRTSAEAAFVAIPDVPAGSYTAVWSFAVDDTWVGNSAGQLLHYDGSAWTVLETGSKDISGTGIRQLWGSSDGQLFFRTSIEFGRVTDKHVELLLALPADADPSLPRVTTGGLWGLSAKEVFVTVSDRQFNKYACGGQFMLFFDGETLHPF